MTADVELVVVDTPEDAAREAADRLAAAARAGAHLALAGGSTPGRAYELAAELQPDWSAAEVWFGDERCVPPDDERSNYRLVKTALVIRLAESPRGVHRIRGELDPERAAEEYDRELEGLELGLAFLGVGADGHTASLFPGSTAVAERERLAVAVEGPDVPRVTLTLPALTAAAAIVFLAHGEEKADAVARAFAGPKDAATPASLVRSRRGPTTAILDRAAAKLLAG